MTTPATALRELPRNGALFGWAPAGTVTTLFVTYRGDGDTMPAICFSALQLAGIPETGWPPFASETDFGDWFWDYRDNGWLIPLAELVAAAPGCVFWVDTSEVLGANCFAVATTVTSASGLVLPQGVYVWPPLLRAGTPVPSLADLLADPSAIDLASRFGPEWSR